ncbi:conserved hypothetical protein (plasmid) [Cupriavidus necator H16]|uniref:Uncharacterized protein n=1 Tax=Cupriavidus necator (strain ATCC 17699 / DSM 428 / KCTC 22496 / NCIMB 10442 / H16 / Stanier 337) TaxID=381666 RepID=Q7WXI4_CUPNH|nr:conserved hypothetical protein [Cupriavidus necator H16]
MQRNRAARHRNGVGIQQRLDLATDWHTELGGSGQHLLQRLPQLILSLITEAQARVASGAHQRRRRIRSFVGKPVQHRAAAPAQVLITTCAEPARRDPKPVGPGQVPGQPLRRSALGNQLPLRLQVALDRQSNRQHRLAVRVRLLEHGAVLRPEAAQVQAIRLKVLERVVELAHGNLDHDGLVDIHAEKIMVAELRGAPRAQAQIDGVKNARLARVTRSDQRVEARARPPGEMLDAAKVADLDFAQASH